MQEKEKEKEKEELEIVSPYELEEDIELEEA